MPIQPNPQPHLYLLHFASVPLYSTTCSRYSATDTNHMFISLRAMAGMPRMLTLYHNTPSKKLVPCPILIDSVACGNRLIGTGYYGMN